MIDSQTFDLVGDEEVTVVVKQCMATLSGLGIFLKQIDIEKEKLFSGDRDESNETLLAQIKEYRWKTQHLLAMHMVGEQFGKELN